MKTLKHTVLKTVALFAGSILLMNTSQAEGLNGPHTHGELEVSILKAPDELVFEMVVSAKDIVGFESAAKTDAEKKRLKEAEIALYTAENIPVLFNFFPRGSCLPYESYVNSDLLNVHSHPQNKQKESFIGKLAKKSPNNNDVHAVGKNGHSDFVMSYVFECQGVSEVALHFEKIFPSIKKINIRKKNVEGKIIKVIKTSKNTSIKLKDI